MMTGKRPICLFILLSLVSLAADAQDTTSRISPLDVIRVRYKDAYIKITYSQPRKRGREIFGKLVPYGQLWRTGANEATEITTTRDILVADQVLKAGTYSVFTIPEQEKWTVIFNSEVGLWGSYNHNPRLDILKSAVPVSRQRDRMVERLTMQFNQRNELADLLIEWDDVQVKIPIKFLN